MLCGQDFSAWHRIKSDELWHYYSGDELLIYVIDETSKLNIFKLGNPLLHENAEFQVIVKANTWFSAELNKGDYCLVGCTVSPGFDFNDFEMAKEENLLKIYPEHHDIIKKLCKK